MANKMPKIGINFYMRNKFGEPEDTENFESLETPLKSAESSKKSEKKIEFSDSSDEDSISFASNRKLTGATITAEHEINCCDIAVSPLNTETIQRNNSIESPEKDPSFDISLTQSVSIELDLNSEYEAHETEMSDADVSPNIKTEVNIEKRKFSLEKSVSMQYIINTGTQTENNYSANCFYELHPKSTVVSANTRLQETYTSVEERCARKLFLMRRCWSFISLYNHCDMNFEKYRSTEIDSSCFMHSKIIFNELRALRSQNLMLQQQLQEINEIFKTKGNRLQESRVPSLVEDILKVEFERKAIVDKRIKAANDEKDRVLMQFNEFIDILLKPDSVLEANESEELRNGNEVLSDSPIESILESEATFPQSLEQIKMKLDHECRLRVRVEEKLNRIMKIINALQEKLTEIHS